MTPTERAKRAIADSDLEECITAAVQAERNSGDLRLADATAALQAALEDLAKVKQERDGLAAKLFKCEDCGGTGYIASYSADGWPEGTPCDHVAIVAAHDRQVAARVLRDVQWTIPLPMGGGDLLELAAEYESGEREVPGD